MTENGSQPVFINNRYRVITKLGEGGMGAVYQVADTQHDEQVLALKVMKRMGGDNEEAYHKLFKREFEVLAGLEHPHVAQAFDYGPIIDGSGFFYTSEFVRGVDLLQGTRGVGMENLLEVMVQSCRALDYVHSRGLIHHDLKPDNILLTEPDSGSMNVGAAEGEDWLRTEIADLESYLGEIMIEKRIVKIIDFGLIMREREDSKRMFGTPQYMPPEKIKKEHCGRRGDLYSLGVVFYQIFTRRLPFISPSMKDLFSRIVEMEPELPSAYLPEIPKPVEDIIMKLMAKDPEQRFNRAAEVIIELNEKCNRDYSLETEVSAGGYITSGTCVGRDQEIRTVTASADAVFSHADLSGSEERFYNMFLVSGEEGIGKTRLIRELKMEFQLRDVLLIDIEFERFMENMSLFVREVLTSLREDPSFAGQVSETELDRAAEFADAGPDTRIPDEIMHFLASAVLALSRVRPVCLVTGSLAHAQSSHITFIIHLSRLTAQSRVEKNGGETTAGSEYGFIGITEMPADNRKYPPVRKMKDEFADPEKFSTVMLETLSREEIGVLISSMFGQGYVPGGFIDQLYDATDGNPRYVFEVIVELTSTLQISRKGSNWQFDKNIESIDPPPAYREALTRRVSEIDRETARVLNVLGVIREEIPFVYIRDYTGYEEDELRFKLSVLEKRNIVESAENEDQKYYRLAFDFLYDVIRDGLDDAEKEHLTGELGEMFEKELNAGNREELSIPLAELFIDSRDAAKGVRYGLRAGENLIGENRYEETRKLYEKLMPLFRPEDYIDFIKAASKLADIYQISGEYRKAIGLYEQILERGDVVLKGWNKALIFRKIAHLYISLAHYTKAETMLQRGREFIIEGEESLESGLLFSSESLAELKAGRFTQSLERAARAESLIREFGDDSPRVRKERLNNTLIRGTALFNAGRITESAEILEKVREDARGMEFSAAEGAACNVLGRISTERGDFEQGDELFSQARAVFRDRSDNISLQEVNVNIAQSLLYRNRYMECLERIEKILLDSAGKEGYENIAGRACEQLGYLNRFFGRHSAARRCFEKSLSFFQQTGNMYLGCRVETDYAEHFTDVNMFEQADTYLKRASAGASEYGYPDIDARVLKIRSDICCRQKDIRNAREKFLECEQRLSSMEHVYTAWLWRGEWLFRNALYNPEYMDASLIKACSRSPVGDIPIISCCVHYASAVQARDDDDRESSWELFRETETLSQRYHFMEINIFSNIQLNNLHVIKTGKVSNRFLNAARRGLEQIEKHLEEQEQVQYMRDPVIQGSGLLVVGEGKDELTVEQNVGNIWGQETAISADEKAGIAETRISPEIKSAETSGSSDFIGKGIQSDLDDSETLDQPSGEEESGCARTLNEVDEGSGFAPTISSSEESEYGDTVDFQTEQNNLPGQPPDPSDERGIRTVDFETAPEDPDSAGLSEETIAGVEKPRQSSNNTSVSSPRQSESWENRSIPPPPPSDYAKEKKNSKPQKEEGTKDKAVSGVDIGMSVPEGKDIPVPPDPVPAGEFPPEPLKPEQPLPEQGRQIPQAPPVPEHTARQSPAGDRPLPPPPPPLPDIGPLVSGNKENAHPKPLASRKEKTEKSSDASPKEDTYDWDSLLDDNENKEDSE